MCKIAYFAGQMGGHKITNKYSKINLNKVTPWALKPNLVQWGVLGRNLM